MCPIANAMVITVKPNASATPTKPIPRPGNAAASTALPQPPKTNQNVPKNSAVARFPIDIIHLTGIEEVHLELEPDSKSEAGIFPMETFAPASYACPAPDTMNLERFVSGGERGWRPAFSCKLCIK